MEQAKTKNDWEITCDRYVGFIDIMGFKNMVTIMTHSEIYEMMKRIEECKTVNENIQWQGIKSKLVSTTTYSDSIMIYSKDNTFESLNAFANTISGISEDLILQNIPFKGAIAFGTMTLDKERSIFFGQPLIDSFLLQEELHFYGVIVHASAEKEMIKHEDDIDSLFLTYYQCPLKNGSSYHLTIHPMAADKTEADDSDEDDYKELLLSVNKLRLMTSGHLRKYIDNTEVYLKFVWNQNN